MTEVFNLSVCNGCAGLIATGESELTEDQELRHAETLENMGARFTVAMFCESPKSGTVHYCELCGGGVLIDSQLVEVETH